ncbi:DGC domain protein [Peptococcaceae bacterium CEB3]|nr:DGC domain protein [Peptococcaceae bacterium CEB3]
MEKMPVDAIKMETARKTIVAQHDKYAKTIGVNGCFGSSNVGQMTGFMPREIVRTIPSAFMRCPLALYPEIEGPSQVLLYDDYQVVIDGCEARCLAKALTKAGVKIDLSYALDEDFNLEKTPGPDFDEGKMKEITQKIMADIRKLSTEP